MTKSNRPLIFLLHAAFFLTGVSTVLIGQVLPILAKRLALNDAELGQFFVAQFTGSLSGVFIYNFLVKKSGFVSGILVGLFSISCGALALNANSWLACAAGFFLIGVGTGTTLPGINMLVAELNPLRTAAALTVLNFFWGVGAILSQPFVAVLSRETSIVLPTSVLAGAAFLIAVSLFFAAPPSEAKRNRNESNEYETPPAIWKSPVAWMIAFFNFLHVGLESGVGGWLTTYSARFSSAQEGAASQWLSATPVYFFLFIVGRGVAPVIFRFLSENRFLLVSLWIVAGGIILIILAESYALLLVGAGVLGFGCSAIFPTNMARFTGIFGPTATRNATPIFILGSLGGAFTTWLIGWVSNYFENLRAGIFVLLASSLILIALQIAIKTMNAEHGTRNK
jgi:MFS transporter, FHS family, glucose/mannose:H+ symporter